MDKQLSLLLLVTLAAIFLHESLAKRPKPRCPWIELQNGRVKIRSRGRVAKFKCRRGFTIFDGDRFATCVRNEWNGKIPKCIRQGCLEMEAPTNGERIYLYSKALVKFHCDPGYILEGSTALYCNAIIWNGTAPNCKAPENPALSCDFESDDLCGWTNAQHDDNFDWLRKRGPSRVFTMGTGPSADHTLGTNDGHYMFIEASIPREEGHRALLYSPVYSPSGSNTLSCFSFYYHMYGTNSGVLNCYLKPEGVSMQFLPPILQMSGTSHKQWFPHRFNLTNVIDRFQIVLEAVRARTHSDIAIDDVQLAYGDDCKPHSTMPEIRPGSTSTSPRPDINTTTTTTTSLPHQSPSTTQSINITISTTTMSGVNSTSSLEMSITTTPSITIAPTTASHNATSTTTTPLTVTIPLSNTSSTATIPPPTTNTTSPTTKPTNTTSPTTKPTNITSPTTKPTNTTPPTTTPTNTTSPTTKPTNTTSPTTKPTNTTSPTTKPTNTTSPTTKPTNTTSPTTKPTNTAPPTTTPTNTTSPNTTLLSTVEDGQDTSTPEGPEEGEDLWSCRDRCGEIALDQDACGCDIECGGNGTHCCTDVTTFCLPYLSTPPPVNTSLSTVHPLVTTGGSSSPSPSVSSESIGDGTVTPTAEMETTPGPSNATDDVKTSSLATDAGGIPTVTSGASLETSTSTPSRPVTYPIETTPPPRSPITIVILTEAPETTLQQRTPKPTTSTKMWTTDTEGEASTSTTVEVTVETTETSLDTSTKASEPNKTRGSDFTTKAGEFTNTNATQATPMGASESEATSSELTTTTISKTMPMETKEFITTTAGEVTTTAIGETPTTNAFEETVTEDEKPVKGTTEDQSATTTDVLTTLEPMESWTLTYKNTTLQITTNLTSPTLQETSLGSEDDPNDLASKKNETEAGGSSTSRGVSWVIALVVVLAVLLAAVAVFLYVRKVRRQDKLPDDSDIRYLARDEVQMMDNISHLYSDGSRRGTPV